MRPEFPRLFATGLWPLMVVTSTHDNRHCISCFSNAVQITGKGRKATSMLSNFDAIYPYSGVIVDGLKVQ